MKRLLFIFSLLISICVSAQIDKVIPNRPSPPKLVNDFTNTLTQYQVDALENKLVAYDDSTSSQIAIVILPTLTDSKTGTTYEDEEVALKILRDWGIGQKDRNNGILILIVKSPDGKEKKIRIEVGYGLEGAVPDITAKSIIDNYITPNFKEGNFYRGLDEGSDAIIRAATGEYKAPAGYGSKKKKGIGWSSIIFIIIFLLIAMAGGGRGGGSMMSRRGSGFTTAWILGSLLGGSGRSGGGGWSGGGGGGGFGGFGGGGGGGGGASGGW
ncbi:MAG TPA: TPM domain-containing protein [Chitinophagaceae bacterium]|nr:TPM domain-containing protein [Chitinophagaceae bacterium]